MTRRRGLTVGIGLAFAALALVAAACTPSSPNGDPLWWSFHLSGWQPDGTYKVDSANSAQGVATVQPLSGPSFLVYDNFASIPTSRTDAGWNHIGDPDSRAGYVVYPYQSNNSAQGKLYNVITPGGQSYDYQHLLAPGEALNNSFAAISPDGQWLVSGEWGTMNRLRIFPMPILNPATAPTGGSLSLSGNINLSSSVRDVQGCTFTSATRLLCSSNDPVPDLQPTPKPLLQIDLAAPLSGGSVNATVTSLGELPQVSACTGTFETEGLDYDLATSVLRVIVVPPAPCAIQSDVYQYVPSP